MSNTTIIECIKEKSAVNGKSRWTSKVGGDGIALSRGDTIEVEGAAINSKGIGGDVIEIPDHPVSGIFHDRGYIDINYYITNDGKFTCPMPYYRHDTYGLNAWSGTDGVGIYDKRYGLLKDPNNSKFNSENSRTGEDTAYQSGYFRQGAFTSMYRGNNVATATDPLIYSTNSNDSNFDYFNFMNSGGGDPTIGGAYLDGLKYYIIYQKNEETWNEQPWEFLEYRKTIKIRNGFVYPASIADDFTNGLHDMWDGTNTDQIKPTFMSVPPAPRQDQTTWNAGTEGVGSAQMGQFETGTGSKFYQIFEQQRGATPATDVIYGSIKEQQDFNGASFITLPANPTALKTTGGGWSCRYMAAKNPFRIVAGTNLNTCPTKIGVFGIDDTYCNQVIAGVKLTPNLGGNTITLINLKTNTVSADFYKDYSIEIAGLSDQQNNLVISASTAQNPTDTHIVLTIRNTYLLGATKTKFDNAINTGGIIIRSKKENAVVNLSTIEHATIKDKSVVISNIPFTQSDEDLQTQDSILTGSHKDKLIKYFNIGKKYLGNQAADTHEKIERDTGNWVCDFDLGRSRSAEKTRASANFKLTPYWITNATTPATTLYSKNLTEYVYARYSEEIYEGAHLTQTQINNGWYIDRTIQMEASVEYDPKTYCDTNDIMIVVCKNRNSGGNIFGDHGVIGFVVKDGQNVKSGGEDIPFRNYIGFNPGHTYNGNEVSALINKNRVRNATGYIDAGNGDSSLGSVQKTRWSYYHDGAGFVSGRTAFKDALQFDWNHDAWCNFIQVGSPNVFLNWNGVDNRFQFSTLHYPTKINNEGATGGTPIADAGTPIITINANIKNMVGGTNTTLADFANGTHIEGVYTAQAGIAFRNIGGFTNDTEVSANVGLDGKGAYELTADNYKNSFWERLGFNFYDIQAHTGVGNTYGLFYQNNQNDLSEIKTQALNIYPITTDALLSTPIAASMAAGHGEDIYGLPMFNLDFAKGYNVNPSATSAVLQATNLPKKLTYPYWLLYSNIVGGLDFYSNNNKSNCLGIITRNYTAGDFAYSFDMNRQFVVQNDSVLTEITQEILNPDFTPADIDDYSVILYKVNKQIGQPVPNTYEMPTPTPKKK